MNDVLIPTQHYSQQQPQPNRSDVISHDVYIWALIDGFLLVAILSGNILTILAVRYSRRLRSLISNLFILSLAVSDLVVGLTLPYHLAFYVGIGLGDMKIMCILRFFLIILACCVSIWNLIAIAVDRYIAICYPLHYSRFMTKKVALILLSTGWFMGFVIAIVPLFWNKWDTAVDCEFDEVLHPWYVAGIITPVFSMVWICLLIVYWRIWKEASKHAKQMRTSGLHENASDWKSVQVVLLIIGSFTVCWMPYFIVACTQIFKILGHSSPVLYKAVFSLAMANSMMNPLIYAWKNTNFRRAFIRLLKCRSPDSQDPTNSNRSIAHRKSSAMATPNPGGGTDSGFGRDNFYQIGASTTSVHATPHPRISGLRQCSQDSHESSLDGGGRDSFDDGVVIVIKNNRVFEFNNNLNGATHDRKMKFRNMHSLSVQSNDDIISNHTTVVSFSHDTESEDNNTPKRFIPEETSPSTPTPLSPEPPPLHINCDNLNNNYLISNNNGSISTLTNSHTLNNSTSNILVNKCAAFDLFESHQNSTANGGKSAMTLSLSANSTALECLGLARPTSFELFKNKSVECVINRNKDTVIGKIV